MRRVHLQGNRKAVVLFEVALAVLIVSLISLFLFRGYHLFLKTGRRSLDYLKMTLLTEEVVWGLHDKQAQNELTDEVAGQGVCSDDGYVWQVATEETEYEGLTKISIAIVKDKKNPVSFDSFVYVKQAVAPEE